MELLEQLKILLNIQDTKKDAVLSLLITKAKNEVCLYLHTSEYQAKYDNVTLDIAILKYNRLGAEGLTSHAYSATNESFMNAYPDYINMQLLNLRDRVKFL